MCYNRQNVNKRCLKMVDRIVNEIRSCLENDSNLAALALALTLPDICGKAEHPEKSVTNRYIDWYQDHIGKYEKSRINSLDEDLPYLSGELVYQLRCSFLHAGDIYLDKKKTHDPQNQHLRFNLEIRRHDDILAISTSSSVQSGKNGDVEERIYNVCVPYLCQILANAALDYYKKNKEKFYFSCNIIDKTEKREGASQ